MVDRRRFLELSSAAIATMAMAGCGSVLTTPVSPENGKVRLMLRNYPSLERSGGSLKILPEGWVTPVYVLALSGQNYAALSPICTHQGCTVGIEGAYLVCPCHGSTYSREGAVLKGPAELALRRYSATLGPNGVLEINLEGTHEAG